MEIYKVIIYNSGDTFWFNEKDQYHRLNGPAVEYPNSIKCWWQNDKLHRLDGPAIEYFNGNKEWWIDGKQYTEKEFNNYQKKEMTVKQIEDILGYSIKIVKE